jgi:hypothetical protein
MVELSRGNKGRRIYDHLEGKRLVELIDIFDRSWLAAHR